MKETYFSYKGLKKTSEAMLSDLKPLRSRHLPLVIPTRSALLVLDMQNYFLDPDSHAYVPSASAVIPGIQRLIEAYRKSGRMVVFSRHINDYVNAGMMAVWWRDLVEDGRPESEISAVFSTEGAQVVTKHQYDAFLDSGLARILDGNAIAHVLICGVMTHLCCETTARSAFMRGYNVWFTVDGTATYNRKFHEAALWNLSHGFAVPVLVEEVLACFKLNE